MFGKKATGGHKHVDLTVLNSDQQAPKCPSCGRQMWWGGGLAGWSCPVCVSGAKR